MLEQNGGTLAGTYTGRFGPQRVTGNLDGDRISFGFDMSGPMGSATVTYTGIVNGDAMSGTMKTGSMAGGTFSGCRQ